MLDLDLADLYGVPTKVLNQAVKRNRSRFPTDFMLQLTAEEAQVLRSQIVTSKTGRGGRRYAPFAFTEQGVAILSSVLRSGRAIQVNILIMSVFVRLRDILATHKDLAGELAEVKRAQREQGQQIALIFEVLDKLLAPPDEPRRRIGFEVDETFDRKKARKKFKYKYKTKRSVT